MAEYTIDVIESAPFGQLAYVIWSPERSDAVVIDPGFDSETILALLKEDKKSLAAILNTHGHVDHIAGNAALKKAYPDAPLIIGRHEEKLLTDPESNLSMPFGVAVTSPPPDRLVDDGDRLELAGFTFEVREIPGHSPGSVVYLCETFSPAFVFSGDVLFPGSVGRTDFPGGDHLTLMAGIFNKLLTLPDDTRIHPGHGGVTTIGAEKQSNAWIRDYRSRQKPADG
ncbi:MBL fold metallo-hydrolase [Paludisphaera borealis]|uniref:Putative metallo-hydrolase n=1 Tax=Paludisphaera borealis TaxID=1387353 RepID=A0A1U7CM63_9BACT|nr:MBL fold metallo-hydrolase [Paludisphaera borealis]APW59998.1 putative metallo-hydrolase [Paludisphaera borealis]